jgi:hypothetical protein
MSCPSPLCDSSPAKPRPGWTPAGARLIFLNTNGPCAILTANLIALGSVQALTVTSKPRDPSLPGGLDPFLAALTSHCSSGIPLSCQPCPVPAHASPMVVTHSAHCWLLYLHLFLCNVSLASQVIEGTFKPTFLTVWLAKSPLYCGSLSTSL